MDVTGPEALTLTEVAAELSAVSGRAVNYVPETEEEAYASRAHFGAADFEVQGWVTSYQAIASGELAAVSDTVQKVTGTAFFAYSYLLAREGSPEDLSSTVQKVTGRPPAALRDVLRADPAAWAHLVTVR